MSSSEQQPVGLVIESTEEPRSNRVLEGFGKLVYLLASIPVPFIKFATWLVIKFRFVDPVVSEKTKCPACGFRGSRINFQHTTGVEKAAIQHSCLMCGAKFYSKLIVNAEKWMTATQLTEQEKIREAAKKQIL